MTAKTIGFIGLGAMGVGMSKKLLEAGYAVCGYDVDGDAMTKLVDAGGSAATSPALAAAEASLLIVCVFSADQAEAVLYGEEGAASTLAKGATVVMCTTMAPEHARAIATRLEETGHLFIDAPVTGGKRGADEGTLTVIASGSEAAMAAADGAFKAMGSRIYRVGDAPGAGSSVKMINQLLVGVHVAAAAEAVALAARAGADPSVVYDVITHGGGNSWAFETRVPNILARDYSPRGVVDIFTKDLGIVADAARSLKFPLPVASAALQQFLAAAAAGYGREDDCAVVKVYEQLAGIDVAACVGKDG
ncbi:MAG: NAD-binding protein [Alphaproteobacteria bacterium]|nr:NAD-binding protein [Alphaproteobacteria bacterium]